MPHAAEQILTIDDNPLNLDLLGGLLRARGYTVRAATSGRRGLEVARLAPPDLVMLDVTMPEMDGYETCRRFKEDPALADIPVIFISALDDAMDKVRAFQVGGADYVTKPFQAEEVLVRVEHQVRLSRLKRDLEARTRSLEEANLRLRELNEIKASFTAMLVHDLRSPLTSLGLALDIYELEREIPDRTLDQCRKAIERTVGMLQEMLELFRSEGGGFPLIKEAVDARHLLEGICEAFAVQAERQGVCLAVEAAGLPSFVEADPAKLERALANLMGNALKHTPTGGRVVLRGDVEEGRDMEAGLRWLRLQVADTGRGIAPEHLPYVFDPYRQADTADRDLGVGLGLAIVQRIAAAHGGRVEVRSRLGVGTTFSLLLPLA